MANFLTCLIFLTQTLCFLQTFYRWVKFQEDVEDGGKRWSKPFVPSIPLAAIQDVKQCFNSGIVAFDVKGTNIVDILGKCCITVC